MEEISLSDSNFTSKVEKVKGISLVDFWASWCGPCQTMAPVIKEIAQQYEKKCLIGKLNGDEDPKTAEKYQIMSIPALIFLKDGKEVDRLVGAHDKDFITDKIDRLLK